MPCPALPYTILLCPALPYPALPYTMLPCPALPYPASSHSLACPDPLLPHTILSHLTPLCPVQLVSHYTQKLLAVFA